MSVYNKLFWTLRKIDQKYLENIDMCCLWRMEKISWNDSMKNKELIKEGKNMLHKIKWWKANWIRHILRMYCLVKYIIEGNIESTERRGRRHQQSRDDIKERKKRKWNHKIALCGELALEGAEVCCQRYCFLHSVSNRESGILTISR